MRVAVQGALLGKADEKALCQKNSPTDVEGGRILEYVRHQEITNDLPGTGKNT